MATPTLFIKIESSEAKNPLDMALKQVAKAFGVTLVDSFKSDGVEAVIAITNSPREACWILNQTQLTTVILTYFSKAERQEAESVVGFFPGRVSAVPYVGFEEGQVEIVPFLLKLVAEKSAG